MLKGTSNWCWYRARIVLSTALVLLALSLSHFGSPFSSNIITSVSGFSSTYTSSGLQLRKYFYQDKSFSSPLLGESNNSTALSVTFSPEYSLFSSTHGTSFLLPASSFLLETYRILQGNAGSLCAKRVKLPYVILPFLVDLICIQKSNLCSFFRTLDMQVSELSSLIFYLALTLLITRKWEVKSSFLLDRDFSLMNSLLFLLCLCSTPKMWESAPFCKTFFLFSFWICLLHIFISLLMTLNVRLFLPSTLSSSKNLFILENIIATTLSAT